LYIIESEKKEKFTTHYGIVRYSKNIKKNNGLKNI